MQLDLTQKPKANIDSLLDLIGATIEVPKTNTTGGGATQSGGTQGGGGGQQSGQGGNNSQNQRVVAAFPDDASKASQYLNVLLDYVTTNKATSFPGRININQASRTVLLTIPGLDSDKVDAIISSREPEYSGQKPEQKHETWLYTQGVLNLDEMKAVWPYITTGGCVYRAQIVGYFDEGGPSTRVEAIIDSGPPPSTTATTSGTTDGTTPTSTTSSTSQTSTQTASQSQSTTGTVATTALPRIVFWRDLSNLGRGFALESLGAAISSE